MAGVDTLIVFGDSHTFDDFLRYTCGLDDRWSQMPLRAGQVASCNLGRADTNDAVPQELGRRQLGQIAARRGADHKVGGVAEQPLVSITITRITPALRRSDPLDAVAAASELVGDRFSGTKIALSLQMLMSHPSWSTLLRGAVVLVASDGWDTDPPEQMALRMARLSRMAHRLIWINPRAAAEEFEPLVGGMAAALPHCDEMLSGHSLRAMREVLLAVGRSN